MEKSVFNKWFWNNCTSITCKNLNIDKNLTFFTIINSKWIIDLNVENKTVKLQDNIGENFNALEYGSEF